MKMCDHTVNRELNRLSYLDSQIQSLTQAIKDGNVNAVDSLRILIMEKQHRAKLLSGHTAKISQCKDGRWRTRLKIDGCFKDIKKPSRDALDDFLVEYYEREEKRKTFPIVFEEWITEKMEYGENRMSSITRYRTDFNRFFPADEDFCRIDLSIITEGDVTRYIKRTIRRCHLTHKS